MLEPCLASIARHRPADPGLSIEVIVADDASTDGTAEWLARVHPDVRVVRLERNGGFCAAANAGIAAARGRFIQLLNNDTEVDRRLDRGGPGPVRRSDGRLGRAAGAGPVRPGPRRFGRRLLRPGRLADEATATASPRRSLPARPVEEVFGASGSSAFYRSAALRRVGGFDPLFGSYYEDIDLAFRLRWAGYRCVFAPRCVIHHDVSATYDHGSPALQRRMARNAEIVFWANLPLAAAGAGDRPPSGVRGAARGLAAGPRPAAAFLLGKCDALRAWPEIKARRDQSRRAGPTSRPAAPFSPWARDRLQDVRNHLRRPAERSSERIAGGAR